MIGMLNFKIESKIYHPFELVSQNFSKDLFEALAPVFPPSQLESFDGDRVGGLVKIRLGIGALSKLWVSEITSRTEHADKVEFVDEGRQLPPPLSKWLHRHVIRREADGTTLIIDDISFSSGSKILDYMIYPALFAMFSLRTPAYKKYYDRLAISGNE